MSEHNNLLELYISEKIQKFDKKARPTKASGASTEIGDILSNLFFVECKQQHNKSNWILERKIYLKLLNRTPINTQKECLWVIENKFGEKIVCMEGEAFFRLIDKLEE